MTAVVALPLTYDHGGLGGLSDDDHSAYWRLPGRVGEQLTVRDAAGTQTFGIALDGTDASMTFTNGDTGFVALDDTMVKVRASSTAFAPQFSIEAPNPRFDMIDTTPTNGDTWVFQVANNNFRIRNLSASDGELRLEERLDLNRQYDPLTAGGNFNVVDFDPSFTTAGLVSSYSPNFVNLSPNVTCDTNFNIVVLRGGGSYDMTGGTIFTWSMFRGNPVISTSVASQVMPSPNVFDNQTTFRVDGGVACLRNARFVGFHDRGNVEVDDPAGTQTLMNDYTSFLAAPITVNDDQGFINITERYGLRVQGMGGATDTQWGVLVENLQVPAVENIGIQVDVQNATGSGFSKEIYLTNQGAIYFRETAGGVGINSPAADDLSIFATADVLIDSANLGFYGAAPVAQQTGVAITIGAVHAALVSLGLITA